MNRSSFGWGVAVGIIATSILAQWELSAGSKEAGSPPSIPAKTVADYVHAVIRADRTIYTTEIVDRMELRGIVFASENWKERGAIPLPAQFLNEAGELLHEQGIGVRFRLISNWPINKRNGPTTEFERTGLAEIVANSDRPYTGLSTEGGIRYFQALYADKAVSHSCVGCHNAHPNSPKRDFKLLDVMGGILLMIPLPQ